MYDPLDVLYQANPEIGSLVYANRAKLLDKDILPYIAHFRDLQHEEQLALLEQITQRLGIQSEVDKTKIVANARVDINRDSEEGATRRVRISEDGLTDRIRASENGETERTRIQANCLIDLQKTKYEIKRQMLADNNQTRKYLSDNQVKATEVEARALKDIIISEARINAEAMITGSTHQLMARINEAEFAYATSLVEAERLRARDQLQAKSFVVTEYLRQQVEIFRGTISLKSEKIREEASLTRKSYDATTSIANHGLNYLRNTGRKRVSVKGKTDHGELNILIEAEE